MHYGIMRESRGHFYLRREHSLEAIPSPIESHSAEKENDEDNIRKERGYVDGLEKKEIKRTFNPFSKVEIVSHLSHFVLEKLTKYSAEVYS